MIRGREFVLASTNPGKLKEMRALLTAGGIKVRSQSDFDLSDIEETGLSFVENAIIKARAVSAASGMPAIADDSGLEVDALDGEPGVRSARFAGAHGDDQANNALLLERLAHIPEAQRTARFRCVIVALAHPADPAPIICEGVWDGVIAGRARGDGGFGYDPLFLPRGMSVTAAELEAREKNCLSHRAQALRALLARLTPDAT
ncbi:MAG: RdgB/HAM1 family non-canonical purine NTP pyrophosphatase [Gammaproteobacteria bacterium]